MLRLHFFAQVGEVGAQVGAAAAAGGAAAAGAARRATAAGGFAAVGFAAAAGAVVVIILRRREILEQKGQSISMLEWLEKGGEFLRRGTDVVEDGFGSLEQRLDIEDGRRGNGKLIALFEYLG